MSPTPPTGERASAEQLGIIGGLIAVSTWGVASVIPKQIDMGGVAIAAYRFGIYGVLVAALFAVRGNRIGGRVMRATFLGGVTLGLDVALFFSAVKLTSIANATVIGALQPAVVAVVAHRVFGEEIRRRDLMLGLVAIAGVGVVVLGGADDAPSNWRGDLLAVGALVAWSAYFVVTRRAKGSVPANEYTIGVALWVAIINVPLALAFGQSLAWPTWESWGWLFLMAIGAGALGHGLMNWSLQQIPLWLGSTFTLLVPIVSSTIAWAFLDEPITWIQIAAISVVLAALAGVVTGQTGIGSRPRPLRR